MSNEKKYAGIIVPAVTPLTEIFGLDEKAIEQVFSLFYQYQCWKRTWFITNQSIKNVYRKQLH